jgi:hypothetical protein
LTFATPWCAARRVAKSANVDGTTLLALDLGPHASLANWLGEIQERLCSAAPTVVFPLQADSGPNPAWSRPSVLYVSIKAAQSAIDRVTRQPTDAALSIGCQRRFALRLGDLDSTPGTARPWIRLWVTAVEADTVPRAAVDLLARGLDLRGIRLPNHVYYRIYIIYLQSANAA